MMSPSGYLHAPINEWEGGSDVRPSPPEQIGGSRIRGHRGIRSGTARRRSVALREALPFNTVWSKDRIDFTAGPGGGEKLSRVTPRRAVEGHPNPPHRLEVVWAVHKGHEVDLLYPDPMLPRNAPADRETEPHDLRTGRKGFLQFTFPAGVEADQGMEVAVTRMEDVRDHTRVALRDRRDPTEDLGEFGSRDHAILQVKFVGDPAHGRNRALPSPPEQSSLLLIPGDPKIQGVVPDTNLLNLLGLGLDLCGRPIQLNQQHRAGAFRVADMQPLLQRPDNVSIHHLQNRSEEHTSELQSPLNLVCRL